MGDGSDTNFIALSGDSGAVYTDKGYIIEGEDLIYVSARLFTSGSYYQAAGLVSKGLAALGKTFRVGTFESVGSDPANNFLNFVSVLATEDNTIINFSDFPDGATIVNGAPTNNILLDSGESYVIAIQPTSDNPDNDNAMIGVLVESDKPIAVNSGSVTGSNQNTDTDAVGQDAGIDQIVPLERVGTEYIFVRGIGPDQIERPLIVAHTANTEVYINGNLEFTIALAGEHWSIPSTFYGVSYDQYEVGPEIGVSSNMYVQTSKPAFAYQFLGGKRPGIDGPFGVGTGVPNQGMFIVPPINCQTPSIVNNIAAINKLGPDFTFEGVVTIVTETGSTVLINGNDISDYPGEAQLVNGNGLFESYTVENLTGNVSVESSGQVYVASFAAYDYATFGGYYSGFANMPDTYQNYIACEVDTDGFMVFDLDTLSALILETQDPLNFTITYHETQEDAENGANALISPYTNLSNPQQLFVNITNNTTGCFIDVPSISIEVQETNTQGNCESLSASENEQLNILVYPNPVVNTDFVTIKSSLNGVKHIKVFDITGKTLIDTTLIGDTLDVSILSSGIYLLNMTINRQTEILKIIIK